MQLNILSTALISTLLSQVSSSSDARKPTPEAYKRPAEVCRPLANNVVEDCGSVSDSFKITNVTLIPKKPVRGRPLDVHIQGMLREEVSFGSKSYVRGSFGNMEVMNNKQDVCEMKNGNKKMYKCPLKPQYINSHHIIQIPKNAPDGLYSFESYALSQTGRRIYNIKIRTTLA